MFDFGPMNITRRENETDVFIPCPFSGPHTPVWKINNIYYQISELPTHSVEVVPFAFGLLIPIVKSKMNGTTFQCFVPSGHPYTLHPSSIGRLLVN